jgi:uncharacterized protein (TIGR03437 family)
VPNGSAARNQIVTLYITGDGATNPPLVTGSGPAAGTPVNALPTPVQNVSVTVGGVQASLRFVGVTPGTAGVTQINYQVPSNIGTGMQPVVVTVGNVSSPPAYLYISQ